MGTPLKNIEDRSGDLNEINKLSFIAEKGIRALCAMYDDHSSDQNSHENIFILKENVHYRMVSLVHQYRLLLRELNIAEHYLEEKHKKNPTMLNVYPVSPHIEKVELEISSVFDNIVLQLSSVFDYLSHLTCYICKKDKTKTSDWKKLANSAYGKQNDISELEIRHTITRIDNEFANQLFEYRSRLIHRLKDKHNFNASVKLLTKQYDLKITASETSLKHFKGIRKDYPNEHITLTFLSSWIIKNTFTELDSILEALKAEILKTSAFRENLIKPKSNNGFMIVSHDPKTNLANPVSDSLWQEYKEARNGYLSQN